MIEISKQMAIYPFNKWVFDDTLKNINEDRKCKRCGCKPTKEGYDAYLGYIKNANPACCGHGIYKPYIIYK